MDTPLLRRSRRHRQSGSFLREALVGVLIFAFGILGLVGLQAQAIRNTNDLQYRGEAIYIANAAIGRMWTMNRNDLKASFEGDKGTGGDQYDALVEAVARLPGTDDDDVKPTVTVAVGPTATSNLVTITVRWQLPGEATPHQYVATVMVGQNT